MNFTMLEQGIVSVMSSPTFDELQDCGDLSEWLWNCRRSSVVARRISVVE